MEPCTDRAPLFLNQDISGLSQQLNSEDGAFHCWGTPDFLIRTLTNLELRDQALDLWGRRLSNEDACGACDRRYRLSHFHTCSSFQSGARMEMDLGVGCFGHAGQTTNGRLGAHHLIIRTLIPLDRMEPWTDGEPLILTSNVMRNPCSVNCHASHAC